MNLKEAKIARKRAFAPYSNFKVGAVIKLKDGTIIHGANVENMSYGLSICAERSALFSLISQGYDPKLIESMTVIGNTKEPISPCGACRQVMFELMPKNTKIYLANLNDLVKETNILELLPYGFNFDDK